MIKKTVFLVCLYVAICIFGVMVLFENNVYRSANDKKFNNIIDIKTNRFYDKNEDKIDYQLLFSYLCYNNNYNDVPVTISYKNKFKKNLSEIYYFEKYNNAKYDYEQDEPNQMDSWVLLDENNTFHIQLELLKNYYDDMPKINRVIYFKYKLDKNGYVDDIEFIKEEVFREDDGTPIIRPNARKFDYQDYYYANYFENLVLGIDLIKFNYSCPFFYDKERPIEDIEWEMKEYALTNNLRNQYDLNKGLVPDKLKEKAYENDESITFNYANNYFSYKNDFPKEKMATVPVYLDFNDESYNYLLSYTITEDGYLDNISLEEE